MRQVESSHYKFGEYVTKERWTSYWHQINEVLTRVENGGRILLIGKGDGIVASVLEKNGYSVDVMDFDENLEPDIVGDVREIDKIINPEGYEAVVCCQVLEHLPRFEFESVITKICKILKPEGYLILSLPQCNIPVRIYIDMPKIHIKWMRSIALFFNREYEFNGEHYWEVDTKGNIKKNVLAELKRTYKLLNQYTVFEYPYHWFIIMQK